jgi:hypothetical protein
VLPVPDDDVPEPPPLIAPPEATPLVAPAPLVPLPDAPTVLPLPGKGVPLVLPVPVPPVVPDDCCVPVVPDVFPAEVAPLWELLLVPVPFGLLAQATHQTSPVRPTQINPADFIRYSCHFGRRNQSGSGALSHTSALSL